MKTCVVVGDSILDRLRIGRVTRQSPEAPDCPVVKLEEERWELGGAANVARWLAAVEGLKVTYFGQWPLSDRDLIEKTCLDAKVYLNPALCPNSGLLTTKERLIVRDGDRPRHLVRVDSDTTMKVSEAEVAEALRRLRGGGSPIDAVVVADYDKGVFHGDAGRQLALGLSEVAGERGVPLIVNSKVVDRWRDVPVSCLICNRNEFASYTGRIPAAAVLIVTQGAGGVDVLSPTALTPTIINYPSLAERIVDVTGAGDAFLTGLTYEWLRSGFYLDRLVETGQRWARACCEQVGVGVPIGGNLDD